MGQEERTQLLDKAVDLFSQIRAITNRVNVSLDTQQKLEAAAGALFNEQHQHNVIVPSQPSVPGNSGQTLESREDLNKRVDELRKRGLPIE